MIKLKFWQIKNIVTMKVLEMDESLRNKCEIGMYNGIYFYSLISLGIEEDSIYLRGRNREEDNYVCAYHFATTEEATEWIAKATEAVRLFNIDHGKVEYYVKTFIAE